MSHEKRVSINTNVRQSTHTHTHSMYAHASCLYYASIYWIMYELSASVFLWQMLSSVTHPALKCLPAPPHTPLSNTHTHTCIVDMYRGHTRASLTQYGCFCAKQMLSHLYHMLSRLLYRTMTHIHTSQLRTGVKALLSGFHTKQRTKWDRETASRCRRGSPFMSASVELITALEIKMRGSNEGLLEIRIPLAVSAAV